MASRPDDRKPPSRSTPISSRTAPSTSRTTPSSATGPRLAASSTTPSMAKPVLRAPSHLTSSSSVRPPSRPTTLVGTRKQLSSVSDTSSAAGDTDENRRPELGRRQSSLAAAGVGSSAGPRVAASSAGNDAGRASRLGGGRPAGTGVAKKPASSRASLGGNITGARATGAATATGRAPGSASGNAVVRPSTATSAGPLKPRLATQPHTPKKLELRRDLDGDSVDGASAAVASPARSEALRSVSPVRSRPGSPLKPLPPSSTYTLRSPPKLRSFAASDNEFELARNGKGHARSQSEVVPKTRPLTAPSEGVSSPISEEQKKKDMRIMGDLLREANLRDILQAEIATLKTKLYQMEKEKTEAAAEGGATGPKKLEERGAEFARWKAEAKEDLDALRNTHARELSALRADVERQRRGVEEEHAKEVAALRAENEKLESLKKEHIKEVGTLKHEVEKGRRRGNSIEASKSREIVQVQKRLEELQNQLVGTREKGLLDSGKVRTDHEKEIAALKHEIEVEKKLRDESAQEIAAVKSENAKDIASLRAEAEKHKQRARSLEASGAKDVGELRQKIQVLQSELEGSKKSSLEVNSSHDKVLAALNEKKDEQAKDISILKNDLATAEQSRTALAKEVSTLQRDLSTQRKAALSAAKELSELKSAHSEEIDSLRAEHATQLSNHSKLAGVESRIADVQAALEQSKSAANENEKTLKQKIEVKEQDREMLAQVIRDLEVEIGRCQEQLDADSVKMKGERDALKKAAAEAETAAKRMQKEMGEMRKQHEKDVAEADTAKKTLHDQITALKETAEKARADLGRAAAEAKKSGEKLQQDLEALRQEREAEISKKESALKASEVILKKMRAESEDAEKRHRDEIARAAEQAAETEHVAQSLREELQALRHLNEQDSTDRASEKQLHDTTLSELQTKLETLQREGTDGNRIVSDLQAELKKLQDSRIEAEKEHENRTNELNSLVERLQVDAKDFESLIEKLQAEKADEAKRLQASLEEMQQESQQLQTRLAEAEVDHESQISNLTSTFETTKREFSEMQTRAADANTSKDKELEQAQTALSDLQAEIIRLKTESSDFKDHQENEMTHLNTTIESLRKEADAATSALKARDEEVKRLQKAVEKRNKDIEAAKSKYLNKVNDLNASISALKKQVSEGEGTRQVVEELQLKISTLQQEVEDAKTMHAGDIEASQKKYLDKVNSLNTTISELESALESNKAEHTRAIEKSGAEHAEVFGAAESKYLDKINSLTSEVEELQQRVSDGEGAKGIVEELQEKIRKLQQDFDVERTAHEEALAAKATDLDAAGSKYLDKTNELNAEIYSLQARVSDGEGAKQIVEELQDKMRMLQQDFDLERTTLEEEIAARDTQLASAEAKYLDRTNSLNAEIESLQKRVSDDEAASEEMVQQLQLKITSLQTDIEASKIAHDEGIAAHAAELELAKSKYLDKTNELNGEISVLEQRVSESAAGDDSAKEVVRDLQEKIVALREEVEAAKAAHESEVGAVRGELEQSTKDHAGKISELETVSSRVAELEAELGSTASRAKEAEEKVEEAKAELANAEERVEKLKADLSRDLEAKEAEVSGLQERVRVLEEQAESLQFAATEAEKKVTDSQAELAKLEEDIRAVKESSFEAFTAKDEEIVVLKGRLQDLEASLESSRAVTDDVAIKDAEVEALRHQVQELESGLETSKRSASEAEDKLQDAVAKIDRMQAEIEALTEAQSQDIESKADLAQEIEAKDITVATFRQQIQDLEANLKDNETAANELQNKYQEALVQLTQLQEDNEALQKLSDEMNKLKDGQSEDLAAKESEVATLQQNISELESNLEVSRSAAADTAELQKHIDELAKEALQKDAAHETAFTKLEQDKEALEKELSTMQQAHDEEVKTLREGHARDVGEIVTKFESEHASPLRELRVKHDALVREKEDLERLVLETQEKEVKALRDVETKTAEIRDLSAMLDTVMTTTKHDSDKAEESAALRQSELDAVKEELEHVKDKYEEVLRDVADKASRVEELSEMLSAHENTAGASQALQDEHDNLKTEWEALKAQLKESQENHASAVRDADEKTARVEVLTNQLADQDNSAETKILQDEHDALKEEWEALKTQLADNHRSFASESDALRENHARELVDLKERYAEPLQQLEHKYATLERERSDAEYRVISIRDKQADELMSLQDRHEQETDALVRKVTDLTNQLAASQDTSKILDLELEEKHGSLLKEWDSLKAQVAESEQNHTEELNILHAEYFDKLSALQEELASAQREKLQLQDSHATAIANLTSEHERSLSSTSPRKQLTLAREDSDAKSDLLTERNATISLLQEDSLQEEERANTTSAHRDAMALALEAAERNHAELLQDRDDTIAALQDQVSNNLEAAETKLSSAIHERDEEISRLGSEVEGLRRDLLELQQQQQQNQQNQKGDSSSTSDSTSRPQDKDEGEEEGQEQPTGDILDRATFIRETEDLKARCAELETALEVARTELLHERERLGKLRRNLTGGVVLTGDGEMMEDPFADPSVAFGVVGGGVSDLESRSVSRSRSSHSGEGFSSFEYGSDVGGHGDTNEGVSKEKPGDGRMSTLEGTLASLRIQARQLEELNEEFLTESSRWRAASASASPKKAFTAGAASGSFVFEQSPIKRREMRGKGIKEGGDVGTGSGSGFGSPLKISFRDVRDDGGAGAGAGDKAGDEAGEGDDAEAGARAGFE